MKLEEIIAMAREAGAIPIHGEYKELAIVRNEIIERFAALVAAATAKEYEERLRFTQERWEIECQSQVEIEREACAKVCDGLQDVPATEPRHCAQDIRARSNT